MVSQATKRGGQVELVEEAIMGPSAPSSFDHRGETEAQKVFLFPAYWLRLRPKVIAPFLPDSVSPSALSPVGVGRGRVGRG